MKTCGSCPTPFITPIKTHAHIHSTQWHWLSYQGPGYAHYLITQANSSARSYLDCSHFTPYIKMQLVHRPTVASLVLFYRCYCGYCSSELTSAVHLYVTFSRFFPIRGASHPSQVFVARRRTSSFPSFFVGTFKPWNTFPLLCFPPRTIFYVLRAGFLIECSPSFPSS